MRKLLLFCLSLIITHTVHSQQVTEVTFLKSYDRQYFIDSLSVIFAKQGVDIYRIQYTSKDLDGSPDTLSGMMAVPQVRTINYPILVYNHGTVGEKKDVPSYLSFEHNVPAAYASMGVVAIAPDYLGLGDDEGIHPYLHADSEAWSGRDMIRAVKSFLPQEMEVIVNDQLFVTGYSQGGHAAMALHRMLEDEGVDISFSAPMSGPYQISGIVDVVEQDFEVGIVSYFVATLLSYQEVYGNIFPDGTPESFFEEAYHEDIRRMIEGENIFEVNVSLINTLITLEGGAFQNRMIREEIRAEIVADNDHPVRQAYRANDVYDWAPKAETRLIYCTADETVPFTNSLLARDTMIARGATNVTAVDVSPEANHLACVTPAAINMIFYLLGNVDNTSTTSTAEVTRETFSVYPNPAADYITIWSETYREQGRGVIHSVQGTFMKSFTFHNGEAIGIDLPPGIYIVSLTATDGTSLSTQKIFVK